MGKNSLGRKYELVVIIDAKLNDEAKQAISKEIADTINKNGGRIINSQVWFEKHKFTFPIKKCTEGTYYLINVEAPSSATGPIQSSLRLNERVLRFSIALVESSPLVKVGKE